MQPVPTTHRSPIAQLASMGVCVHILDALQLSTVQGMWSSHSVALAQPVAVPQPVPALQTWPIGQSASTVMCEHIPPTAQLSIVHAIMSSHSELIVQGRDDVQPRPTTHVSPIAQSASTVMCSHVPLTPQLSIVHATPSSHCAAVRHVMPPSGVGRPLSLLAHPAARASPANAESAEIRRIVVT